MTQISLPEEIAAKIRDSEGPIQLIDSSGREIGVVRRPPTIAEIERAKSRASQDGSRLSWAQVVAKIQEGDRT